MQKSNTHAGEFGEGCGECHNTTSRESAEFDHSQTAFPLTGAHLEVACHQCHVDNQFSGTPQECSGCHAEDNTHAGEFGEHCGECHSTTSWQGGETRSFANRVAVNRRTRFDVTCQLCHVDNVFLGTPQVYTVCHLDPDYHLGLFALQLR